MTDDALWAPWRLAYVQGASGGPDAPEPAAWPPGAERSCFLCRAAAAVGHERALGVLERRGGCVVLTNRFPYASGHLLIAPADHRAGLADLDAPLLLALQERLRDWCGILSGSLRAEGFNIGLNLGRVAGAGAPGHLHWHVVPRWTGDTNFMPTTAGVRVLSQALDSLWEQLHAARLAHA